MLDINLVSLALGLFIGFLMALSGAGGAILSLPLLMFFLNLTTQQAAPIALLAVFMMASIASILGLKQGIVRYKAAGLMAIMGMIAAPIGVSLAYKTSPLLLQGLFVMVLLYVAWHALNTKMLNEEICNHFAVPCEVNPSTSKLFWTASCTKRLILTGSLAGFLSGLLGLGGGFIVVPSMQKISNLDHRTIVATSLTMVAVVSLVSIVSHADHMQVQWSVAIPFVTATVMGSIAARSISRKIEHHIKNRIFSAVAAAVALVMLLRLINQFVQ